MDALQRTPLRPPSHRPLPIEAGSAKWLLKQGYDDDLQPFSPIAAIIPGARKTLLIWAAGGRWPAQRGITASCTTVLPKPRWLRPQSTLTTRRHHQHGNATSMHDRHQTTFRCLNHDIRFLNCGCTKKESDWINRKPHTDQNIIIKTGQVRKDDSFAHGARRLMRCCSAYISAHDM